MVNRSERLEKSDVEFLMRDVKIIADLDFNDLYPSADKEISLSILTAILNRHLALREALDGLIASNREVMSKYR